MTHAIRQARLFDADDGLTVVRPIVMFAALPSNYPEHQAVLERLRSVCRSVGRRWNRDFLLRSGEDAPSNDPGEVSRWQRRMIADEVDALFAVHGESWGCGREYTLAGEFKIPRLQALPESVRRSAARGPDGCGLAASGGFSSMNDLGTIVEDWLDAFVLDIQARHDRRTTPRRLSETIRQSTLREWNKRDERGRRDLAMKVGATVAQLDSILMSDRRYAEEHVESVLQLAVELGALSADGVSARVGDATAENLDEVELRGFDRARAVLRLDSHDAARLLNAGSAKKRAQYDLQLAGVGTRDSLRSSNGWLKLWRGLCDEHGT